jgi:hypothetical protein
MSEGISTNKKLFAVYLGGRSARCDTELQFDIDDCLEINEVDGQRIHLEPTPETALHDPQNGYHVIPPQIVAAYALRQTA